jgi:hypothetical protein
VFSPSHQREGQAGHGAGFVVRTSSEQGTCGGAGRSGGPLARRAWTRTRLLVGMHSCAPADGPALPRPPGAAAGAARRDRRRAYAPSANAAKSAGARRRAQASFSSSRVRFDLLKAAGEAGKPSTSSISRARGRSALPRTSRTRPPDEGRQYSPTQWPTCTHPSHLHGSTGSARSSPGS